MMTEKSKENLHNIIVNFRGRGLDKDSKIVFASAVAGNPKQETEFLKVLIEHPTANCMELEKYLTEILTKKF